MTPSRRWRRGPTLLRSQSHPAPPPPPEPMYAQFHAIEQTPLIDTYMSVMNAPAGRSTGEGGGALGSGKPPWGGKGGPILSQDLNRHDGSWSRRLGRRRPASLRLHRPANLIQGYAGSAGGRCLASGS